MLPAHADQVDRILISNSQHCGRSLRRFHNHTSAFVKAVKGSWLFVEMLALLKLALPIVSFILQKKCSLTVHFHFLVPDVLLSAAAVPRGVTVCGSLL